MFQPLTFDLNGTIVKGVTDLLAAAAAGTVIPSAVFHVRKPASTTDYQTITLSNVKVLGYDMASGVNGQLSLSYSKIDVEYKPQNPDGSLECRPALRV